MFFALTIYRYRPLCICLLIALIVRILLVIQTHGVIDGDEAIIGIQAQHILHGERPVYFYGQAYMGVLESYLVALLFAVVGSSVWALRAEPILLSLLVVWLTWRLASVLAESAQLSPRLKQQFATLASLFAAIPPLYDTVLQLRTLGGYVETFVLMLLLLLSAVQLTRRGYAGASFWELMCRWAGIGLIIGLGLWINPLLISAILTAVIWIGWHWRSVKILLALAGIPACILGLAPALLWGAAHQWQNFTYLLHLSTNTYIAPEIQVHYPNRLSLFFGLTSLYTSCTAPRIISGALPRENSTLAFLQTPTLLLGLCCLLLTATFVALSFLRPLPFLLHVRRLAALPVIFGACTAFMFCATTTAAPGLLSCNFDIAGRYATPLMLALPFFFATIFTASSLVKPSIQKKMERQLQHSEDAYHFVHLPIARVASYVRSLILLHWMLFWLLVVTLTSQVWSYVLTDPGSTFQSPYCTSAPANDDLIIAYMQKEHIHYAWATNWIAYPLVFKTNGSIIAADPRPILRHWTDLDRIPANTVAIAHADRPSIISLVQHSDSHPIVLKILDTEGVTYRVARFPSQPGTDVLVVTPLNRTLLPFAPGTFYYAFVCNEPPITS